MSDHFDPMYRAENYRTLSREERGVPTWNSRLKSIERVLNAGGANPALLAMAPKLPMPAFEAITPAAIVTEGFEQTR